MSLGQLIQDYPDKRGSLTYRVLKLIKVKGHETGWLEETFTTPAGKKVTNRKALCECYFTQGIGWKYKGGYFESIHTSENPEKTCNRFDAAIRQWRQELYRDYCWSTKVPQSYKATLEADLSGLTIFLLTKIKEGKFVEPHESAYRLGCFHQDILKEFIDCHYADLIKGLQRLAKQRQIRREGKTIHPLQH